MNLFTKQRLRDTENKTYCNQGREEEGGINWEFGMDIYLLLPLLLLSRFSRVRLCATP